MTVFNTQESGRPPLCIGGTANALVTVGWRVGRAFPFAVVSLCTKCGTEAITEVHRVELPQAAEATT